MYIKLKEIRNRHGYTVQQLADKIGISKSYYSQLENRRRRLSYDMAAKIAKVFSMKPDQIFYEDHITIKEEKRR